MVELQVHESKGAIGESLCARLVALSVGSIKSDGVFNVALSGGSIPSMLSTGNLQAAFDVASVTPNTDRWHVYLADERLVDLDHDDSNYKALMSSSFVGGGLCSVYPIDPSLKPSECATDYACKLPGVFHCVVLGMGEDGHTCSLFPGHKLLEETGCRVGYIEDSPKMPPVRVTLMLEVLNQSKNVVFAAAGAGKASVLGEIFDKSGEKKEGGDAYPCARVDNGGDVLWLIDEAAAANL